MNAGVVRWTIFRQLFFFITLLIVSFASLLGCLFVFKLREVVLYELAERAQVIAGGLVDISRKGLETANVFGTLDPVIVSVMREADMAYVHIVDREGKVLASSSQDKGWPVSASDRRVNPHLGQGVWKSADASGQEVLEVEVPIFSSHPLLLDQGAEHPKSRIGEVRVALSLGALRRQMAGVVGVASVVTGALLLGGAWMAFRFSRGAARRVDEMVQAAQQIGAGNYGSRLPTQSNDELGDLAQAMAKMAQDLEISREKMMKAQERSIQSEKLAAVGQLAGGVAHEINNPLGVILGFAQVLEQRVSASDPLRLPVTSILREATRCKNLVKELLTFSRTGKAQVEPVDLSALIRETLPLLEAKAKTQGVSVIQEKAEGLPPIRGSRTQLQQILVNLGVNALDAMSKGGTLTFRASREGETKILLQAVDTGTGIPPEIRAKIFEPFFTTKEVGKGTGLGLSLVHELVQQHGGTIEVTSEMGQGTTFSMRFPLVGDAGGVVKRGVTILVVDDEALVRQILLRVLRQVVPDAQVVEATDGFEAGRQVAKLRPDLVILDLHLPGVDGFRICQIIKSDPQLKGTKVLAMTGLSVEEARPRILAAGADEFLAKPFETAALIKKVGSLLGLNVSA